MSRILSAALITLLACPGGFALAQQAEAEIDMTRLGDGLEAESQQVWAAWGGELRIEWNRHLLGDFGVKLSQPAAALGEAVHGADRLGIRETVGLQFSVRGRAFEGFVGGAVSVKGGYAMTAGGRDIALRDFSLRPRAGNPFVLDLVTGDGKVWFYVDRLMYALESNAPVLAVHAMDLRATDEFAELVGDPAAANMVVAGMRMLVNIVRGGFEEYTEGCPSSSKWPGMAAPGGEVYQADVFMQTFTMSYMRRTPDADGPGGTDGGVVFAPSSRLKNNRNNGVLQQTIADPNGTSSALYAADVVWRTKFSANCPPYENDQHPYLIWNLYRIDAAGKIEQVGRSGVKHAFLTINSACDDHPGSGYILGRGCEDVYGTGNNDSGSALGPRHEVIAATGQWGRCGSIYDPNCDNNDSDFAGYTSFDNRMLVRESAIDPLVNAGASYLFESWYVVRDDINIYNTMQTRPSGFTWNGSTWSPSNGSPLLLGPAIDRWVDPAGSDPARRNVELVLPDGRSKIAVRTTDIGGGQFRYDYAVMNFDFGVPKTEGAEPSLRVVSNDGFAGFRVPVPAGVDVSSIEFGDGDNLPGNNWTSTREADAVVWAAPAGGTLNWGSMYRFGFTAAAAPEAGPVALVLPDENLPASSVDVDSLRPNGTPIELYGIGGLLSGLGVGGSLELALNGGSALLLQENGVFGFADALPDGAAYAVSVPVEPVGQNCTVTNGTGNVSGADVVDVSVDCEFIQISLAANDDNFALAEDGTLSVPAAGVLANDDVQVADLLIEVLSGPGNGVLTAGLAADGSFAYQPNADFCGPDGFQYRLSGSGLQDSASVALSIDCVNDAPRALGTPPNLRVYQQDTPTVAMAAYFMDPEAQPLVFSALALPEGLSIDPQSGVISGTVSANALAGSPYYVLVRASDGSAEVQAEQRFRIEVRELGADVFISGFEGD